MSDYEIPDLIFELDADGNVTNSYTNQPKTPTPTTPTPKVPTDKKWWEQVISVVPNLVTAIFGQSANANPVYTTQPATTNSGGNSNTILIIAAVVIVAVLMISKGKK